MYFATTNAEKIKEASRILGVPVEGMTLPIDEIQTLDAEECARKKALAAYAYLKTLVLVEDTALFFEALNGLPGVYIDSFMKALGIDGLLKIMATQENRKAVAQTTLAISDDGKHARTFIGKVSGSISRTSRGENGFGWGPIFIPRGARQTFAEMSSQEKDLYSMRRLAFEAYKQRGGLVSNPSR